MRRYFPNSPERASSQQLRHTFGSVLIMSGANLVSVQKLLGHSNPRITAETYAHLAPDYLLSEVNLLRFGVDHLAPVAKISQPLEWRGVRDSNPWPPA